MAQSLTFSGAVNGKLADTSVLTCGIAKETDPTPGSWFNLSITGSLSGTTYIFGIDVGNGTSPGSYKTTGGMITDPVQGIGVQFYASGANSLGSINVESTSGGTVTIDPGMKTGSVDATLDDSSVPQVPGSSTPLTTVTVKGTWKCP